MSGVKTVWPPRQLQLLEKQLDMLAAAVDAAGDRDVDDQIWLTRFLVVRTCGYLEQVVHQTVTEHVWSGSGGTARSFAISWLERSKNPSLEYLFRTVGRIDQKLREDLEEFLDEDNGRLREQVGLLVGRRNSIAHGHNEGMSSRNALQLVVDAKDVAAWFILNLEPNRRY